MADIKPEDLRVDVWDSHQADISVGWAPTEERMMFVKVTYLPAGVHFIGTDKSGLEAKSLALMQLHAFLDAEAEAP